MQRARPRRHAAGVTPQPAAPAAVDPGAQAAVVVHQCQVVGAGGVLEEGRGSEVAVPAALAQLLLRWKETKAQLYVVVHCSRL